MDYKNGYEAFTSNSTELLQAILSNPDLTDEQKAEFQEGWERAALDAVFDLLKKEVLSLPLHQRPVAIQGFSLVIQQLKRG